MCRRSVAWIDAGRGEAHLARKEFINSLHGDAIHEVIPKSCNRLGDAHLLSDEKDGLLLVLSRDAYFSVCDTRWQPEPVGDGCVLVGLHVHREEACE